MAPLNYDLAYVEVVRANYFRSGWGPACCYLNWRRPSNLSVSMSVGPSLCQSVSLHICLSICLSPCLSVHFSVNLSVSMSVCQSVSLPTCLSVRVWLSLSLWLVYLSVHLSVIQQGYLNRKTEGVMGRRTKTVLHRENRWQLFWCRLRAAQLEFFKVGRTVCSCCHGNIGAVDICEFVNACVCMCACVQVEGVRVKQGEAPPRDVYPPDNSVSASMHVYVCVWVCVCVSLLHERVYCKVHGLSEVARATNFKHSGWCTHLIIKSTIVRPSWLGNFEKLITFPSV